MKTALVTGSAGFIGRHMCRALEDGGYDVLGIDIAAGRDAQAYFTGDHTGSCFDVVVHAAAVIGGRAKIDGDPLALAVNLELDAALFRWAVRTQPGRVVYLSSSAVYPVYLQAAASDYAFGGVPPLEPADPTALIGTAVPEPRSFTRWEPEPLSEVAQVPGSPLDPDALYGWCKLTGEKLAMLARDEGVAVTVARPFSGYGEDQSTEYPFAAFAARARARENPFVIWGTGEQVRDWVHVDDVCAAIMEMIHYEVHGPVNIGTGRGTSMRQLAELMCEVAGYSPEYQAAPAKPAGVAHRVASIRRLTDFYTPRISLEEGVTRALKG
jgi:nucleoside-diphosphate-sugar epimerase